MLSVLSYPAPACPGPVVGAVGENLDTVEFIVIVGGISLVQSSVPNKLGIVNEDMMSG